MMGGTTYFEHHKTIAIVSPAYNVLIGWVFEHSVARISKWRGEGQDDMVPTYLYSLRT